MEDKKVQIKYPCIWKYKIITEFKTDIKKEIKPLNLPKYEIEVSHQTKKFISYNLTLSVIDDEERRIIFGSLLALDKIKYVL